MDASPPPAPHAVRSRCPVFVATRVDGVVARRDGGSDALHARVPAGEDCGCGACVAGIDAIVTGRGTFVKVASFAAWPYGVVQRARRVGRGAAALR